MFIVLFINKSIPLPHGRDTWLRQALFVYGCAAGNQLCGWQQEKEKEKEGSIGVVSKNANLEMLCGWLLMIVDRKASADRWYVTSSIVLTIRAACSVCRFWTDRHNFMFHKDTAGAVPIVQLAMWEDISHCLL